MSTLSLRDRIGKFASESSPRRFILFVFPSLKWFRAYDWFQFLTDAFAGLTVGLVCSVQGLSYSLLAKLPQSVGFHFFLPMLVEALLSSSPNLIGGPVALVSLSVGQSLSSQTNAIVAIQKASIYSFYVGLFLVLLGLLGGGHFSKFASQTVILGFTSAVSVIIICNEMGALLGIPIEQTAFAWREIVSILLNLRQLNVYTTALSILILTLLYLSKYSFSLHLHRFWSVLHSSIYNSFLMVAIIVTITLVNVVTGFTSWFDIDIVGSVPQAFPHIQWPNAEAMKDSFDIRILMTLSLLVLIETTSIALSLGAKQGYKVDLNREVVALGLANIGGSFVQCYPFAASFSRSAVNANAGAKSPLSQVVAALFLIFASWGLPSFIRYMPKCLLASVICLSVSGMIEWEECLRLLGLDKVEASVFIVSFVSPLLMGSVIGLMIAMLYSYLPICLKIWKLSGGSSLQRMYGLLAWKEHFLVTKETEQSNWIRIPPILFFGNITGLKQHILEVAETESAQGYRRRIWMDASHCQHIDTVSVDCLENLIESNEYVKSNLSVVDMSPLLFQQLSNRKIAAWTAASVDMVDSEHANLLENIQSET